MKVRLLKALIILPIIAYLIDFQAVATQTLPRVTAQLHSDQDLPITKLSNRITGHHVEMKIGRYGIEAITETNGRGELVRTENYSYKVSGGRVREYSYNIWDKEPTLIETSQGLKPVSSPNSRGGVIPAKAGIRAPESAPSQRGGSPLQAYTLRPVTESNCVAVKRGGEQLEVKDQSIGYELDSAVCYDESADSMTKSRPLN